MPDIDIYNFHAHLYANSKETGLFISHKERQISEIMQLLLTMTQKMMLKNRSGNRKNILGCIERKKENIQWGCFTKGRYWSLKEEVNPL